MKTETDMSDVPTCPDIFTTEQAVVFFNGQFPSAKAFLRTANKHNVRGVRGGRSGNEMFFAREQLELLRLAIFGLDVSKGRNTGKGR